MFTCQSFTMDHEYRFYCFGNNRIRSLNRGFVQK